MRRAGTPASQQPRPARTALLAALGLLLGVCSSSVQGFVLPTARPGVVVAPRGRADLTQPPTQQEARAGAEGAQQAEAGQRRRGVYGRQSVIMMPSSEPAVRVWWWWFGLVGWSVSGLWG